jgi:uncharacterized membrane protein YdjX (TVP38/TMEM64 family)
MNRLISKHGALAVAAVRMIPVAPYSLVNLAAGAVRVPFREFVVGTFLGMSPGVFGITFFENQVEELLRDPKPNFVFCFGGCVVFYASRCLWLPSLVGCETDSWTTKNITAFAMGRNSLTSFI